MRQNDPPGGGVGVAVGVLVGVAVGPTGVAVGVAVEVGVGVGAPPVPQEGNRKEPMRVCQGAEPVTGMYSVVNQNVQSSAGSIVIIA
jgi:hypothetical protein